MHDQEKTPKEVPAGGRGADTGAVDAARIDESDQAELPNISSQNDIPGVGTRAADGSMEPDGDQREATSPAQSEPSRGSVDIERAAAVGRADAADLPIEDYEPGVDAESARTSGIVGDETAKESSRKDAE